MSSARKIRKQNKLIQEKTMLFDALPQKCTGCSASYDKNNKEQAFLSYLLQRCSSMGRGYN